MLIPLIIQMAYNKVLCSAAGLLFNYVTIADIVFVSFDKSVLNVFQNVL